MTNKLKLNKYKGGKDKGIGDLKKERKKLKERNIGLKEKTPKTSKRSKPLAVHIIESRHGR